MTTPSDPSADENERRRGARHLTCYPLGIQRGEPGDTSDMEVAVVNDLSVTGAFLLLVAELPVGARVKLHLDIFEEVERTLVVEGAVVRVERRPSKVADTWGFGAAVSFHEPQPSLEAAIERLAQLTKATI
ncbi:MAG: PilZ domain-containing protein [Polyangiaceae bacterium]